MKTSEIVFYGLLIIFLFFGVMTAPINFGLWSYVEHVGEVFLIGFLFAYVISWVYGKLTHEAKTSLKPTTASIQ